MQEDKIDCSAGEGRPSQLAALRNALARQRIPLQRMAQHYALLGGETRLKILSLLDRADELCVCDLARVLEMTPAAVSQHLSRLRAGSLVNSRRDGMTIYYRLSEHASATVVSPRLELADELEANGETIS
jgi:DNA-binding transcriptional ArsR family regulator